MENIISIEEFDPKHISLGDPTKNKYGGTAIPVRYNCPRRGSIPFIIKLPRCDLPYGASQYPTAENVVKGEENKINYSLNVSFNGFDDNFSNNPKIGLLFNKWKKMEKWFHKELMSNSQKYLKDDIDSIKVIEKMCTPIIKHSKDSKTGKVTNKYPPTFSIKLRRFGKEGAEPKFNAKVMNHENEEIKLEADSISDIFPRYSSIRGLIQCTSIFVGAKISMSFSAVQVKTYPGKNQITGNAFENDSDDDEPSKEASDAEATEDKESEDESGEDSEVDVDSD